MCKDGGGQEDQACADAHKYNVDVLDHVNYFGIDFLGILAECLI
jgi:hypothetical protein